MERLTCSFPNPASNGRVGTHVASHVFARHPLNGAAMRDRALARAVAAGRARRAARLSAESGQPHGGGTCAETCHGLLAAIPMRFGTGAVSASRAADGAALTLPYDREEVGNLITRLRHRWEASPRSRSG